MDEKRITRDLDVGCINCIYDGLGLTMVDFNENHIWIGYGVWVKRYKEGRSLDTDPFWIKFVRIV